MTSQASRPGPWWLLPVPPLLAAAVAFAALAWASDGFTAGGDVDAFVVGTVLWNVSPGLVLTAVAVATLLGSRGRRSRVALLVGGAVLLVFVGLATADIVWSDSSTAALGFLFLPLLAWLIVLATVAAVLFLGAPRRAPSGAVDRP